MKYFIRCSIAFLFFALAWLVVAPVNAQDVTRFEVLEGTLELVRQPNYGYQFKSDDLEILYEIGMDSPFQTGGIDGLYEVGFKLENGKQYLPKNENAIDLRDRAARENPGVKLVAVLFRGEGGSVVEVGLVGKTDVYRIRLLIGEVQHVLWANRNGAEMPKKNEK